MQTLRFVALLASVVVVFTILLVQSRARGGEGYNRTIDAARRMRELDGRLDNGVLEVESGLKPDDGTLTRIIAEMKALQREMERSPAVVDDREVALLMERTARRTEEKASLVAEFRSADAVFRDSIASLPTAARDLADRVPAPLADRASREVTELLASVMQCTVDCTAASLEDISQDVEALSATRTLVPAEDQETFDVVLKLATTVATLAPRLEGIVRSLPGVEGDPYDDLYLVARGHREAAIEGANVYRVVLVLMSSVLLAAVAVMTVRYRRNAGHLEQALESLAQEKGIVEEKQRELTALNHSLESRVEARTRELSGSREQYRTLLETTHAIPWEMKPGSLRFGYVGPQATVALGHPTSDWMEEDFFQTAVHPDDLADTREWFENLSADGAQGEVEFRMVAAAGRAVWLRTFASTVHDDQGRPIRRGIFLDVTTRHVLEAELRSAQKLESVGRLAAGIAHEINTPVQFVSDSVHFVSESFTALASLVGAFRKTVEAGPEARAALVDAAREADAAADTDYILENIPQALASSVDGLERIATIVKSLKEFSHPDFKQKSPVDLNSSIRSTLTIAANEYKHVAEVQTAFGDLPRVVCHAGEINQVLLNLIVNAAHAISDAVAGTDKRGVIKVRTWAEESTVVICIKDTGTGIPSKIRDKIFDPFFTTKDVGRGTGQGLPFARSIVVDKHGGELTFETEVGLGTAFLVRLPIDDAKTATAA